MFITKRQYVATVLLLLPLIGGAHAGSGPRYSA